MISERDAARRLKSLGLGLSASQHLLSTGIAGPVVRAGGMKLYDARLVEELASRPPVSAGEVRKLFPDGAMVVRLPRARTADAGAEWPDTADELAGPWLLGKGPGLAVWVKHLSGHTVPLMLTVAGCVLSGATTTDVLAASETQGTGVAFALSARGAWLQVVRGRMLSFGRGAPVEVLGDLAYTRRDRYGRSAERARR